MRQHPTKLHLFERKKQKGTNWSLKEQQVSPLTLIESHQPRKDAEDTLASPYVPAQSRYWWSGGDKSPLQVRINSLSLKSAFIYKVSHAPTCSGSCSYWVLSWLSSGMQQMCLPWPSFIAPLATANHQGNLRNISQTPKAGGNNLGLFSVDLMRAPAGPIYLMCMFKMEITSMVNHFKVLLVPDGSYSWLKQPKAGNKVVLHPPVCTCYSWAPTSSWE